jgi:PAS domain S-box-containing protein
VTFEGRAAPTGDDATDPQQALLELGAILDNAAAGILFTRDRTVQRCNQRAAEIFGYASAADLIGQPGANVYFDAESYERIGREAGPLLAAGRAFHAEWLLKKADGSPVWCDIYGKAVDPAHTDRGTVWIIDDVTAAKRTEEALRKTLGLMGAIMDNAPVGIVLSRDRRITGYNPKFREMFGFRGDAGIGQPGRAIYRSDEEYEALGREASPLLSQGKPLATELFMRRQDGSDLWVSLIGYVQNQDNPREGTIWLIEDHTERKHAEETLKHTRDELRAIFENASVGILFTRNRTFQHCNRRAAEIFGYATPEALIGQPGISIYPDTDSYERIGREAGPLLAAGQSFQGNWLFRRADGSPLWCRIYGKSVDPTRTEKGTVWIVEDITEAKRTEDALQQTMRELDALVRNAPVGLVFTRERHIVRYNERFSQMYGFEGDSGLGLAARELYTSDEAYEAFGKLAAPLLSQGKPVQTEMFMRRQDGTDFWVNLIGYVQNLADPGEGTIWIGEDRSDYKRAEDALQRANAELVLARDRAEVANQAKSDFLAKMSHELRTPLNAILGYAQILKREGVPRERVLLGLDTIEQSGQHLLTLINDILDLSRIEAGKLDLDPALAHLPTFLRVVSDIVRVRAEQKDLLFLCETPPELPEVVRIDEKRLRQVLLNLLSNAVKFTDRGEVRLVVRATPGWGECRLGFQVWDTGIGIAADQLPRLFQPFEQLSEVSRRTGGTGLGLAISRELVRAMGGDIVADSTPGVGTRFAFELRVPIVDGGLAEPPRPRAVTGYHGPRRTVLVVDDMPENRALIADYLKPLDFTVREAGDGRDGLEQARTLRPDLILMDNVMPVMSGPDATRRLRQEPAVADVPVIAISASASQADRDLSFAAGADAFLHKPIDFDEMLRHIATLLRLRWTYESELDDIAPAEDPVVAPPREQMQALHHLAMVGNMNEIRRHAARIAAMDPRYRPFAEKLDRLAQGYQSRAIRRFVEANL